MTEMTSADGDRQGEGTPTAGMSVRETCVAIGLSRPTVCRRLRAGVWPGARSGGKWLVSTNFVHAVTTALAHTPGFDLEAFAATWMERASASDPALVAQTAE